MSLLLNSCLAKDHNYVNSAVLMSKLEEVSRLLIIYSKSILKRVQYSLEECMSVEVQKSIILNPELS